MHGLGDGFTLSNGVQIPCMGFGTWDIPLGEPTVAAVTAALKAGFRHVDCAELYGNQLSVGRALKACGLPREAVFINSKVWNNHRGYDKAIKAFEATLAELGLEYLDMYLIHWPATARQYADWRDVNADTWRALEKLYKDGRVRAIGVSNFWPHHLAALMATAEIAPMVNQIEYHPGQTSPKVTDFCRQNNIQVEAWSPLGEGAMLHNAVLKEIAGGYGKSVAQLCLKWCLQNGVLPLPRSCSAAHIAENAAVFDFELTAADMERINGLAYFEGSGLHPDELDEEFM